MRPGQAVIDEVGDIGIITESIKKSGINKGKVSVMFVGGSYPIAMDPQYLTPITIAPTNGH